MLRLLHLAFTLDETSEVLNEHALGGRDRYDLAICSFNPPDLAYDPGLRIHAGDGTIKGFVAVLLRALRTERPDVVHSHSAHVGALAQIFGPFARVGYRRRSVHTVHTSFPNIKPRNRLLTAVVFGGAARIIGCSRASRDSFPAAWRRVAGRRLSWIANGVDLSRIDAVLAARPPAADRPASPLQLVSVGRLMAIKGHHVAVDAVAQCRDVSLRIVGTGVSATDLAARIERLDVADRVALVGGIARDEVYGTMAGADLFVSMSTVEGLPMAALEALGCGCPAILSDIPPHRELANGSEAVTLVPVGDPAAAAAAIIRFAALDPTERARRRRAARAVAECFTLTDTLDRYGAVYAEVADRNQVRHTVRVR